MNKIILLMFLLIIISYPVYAEIISSNKELVDYGNHKELTVYGVNKFILNSESKYDYFTNVVFVNYNEGTNEIIIKTLEESYKIIPYIICDYNKIPLNKAPFGYKFIITKENDYYQIETKLTNVKCILDNLILDFTEFGEIKTNGKQIYNNKISADLTDYIDSGYKLSLNEKELYVSNVVLDKDGNTILDPIISIYNGMTEDGYIQYINGTFNLNDTIQSIGAAGHSATGTTYNWFNYFIGFNTSSIKTGNKINYATFNFYNFLAIASQSNCYFSLYNISDFGVLDKTDWNNHSPKFISNSLNLINVTGWNNISITNQILKGSNTFLLMNSSIRGNASIKDCWSVIYTFDYPILSPYLLINYSEIISCNISNNPLLGLNRRIPVLCTLSVIDKKNCVINVYGSDTLLSSSPKSEYVKGIGLVNGFKSKDGLLHGYYDSFMMESGQDYTVKVICSDGITKYIQTVSPEEKGLSEMQGTIFWGMDNLAILAVSIAFLFVLALVGYKIIKNAWG